MAVRPAASSVALVRRRPWVAPAALAALVLAGACGDPRPAPVADASLACSDDCTPYVCSARTGACGWYCTAPSMCAADHVCIERVCVGTACTVATAATDCGPYACVNGSCAHDCAIAPCNDGYYCRGDTSTCAPHCDERLDRRCAGYLCDVEVGECEPYCFPGELDCAPGFHCAAGNVCLPDAP